MRVSIMCEKSFYELSSRDTAEFFKALMSFVHERECNSIIVSIATIFPDKDNKNMTRVTIGFQLYKQGETGHGSKFYYRCYRALDWSCSNICIEKA